MNNLMKKIEFSVIEGIGILTLNNPPENFLIEPDFLDLKVFKKWIKESGIKGLVIIGKGRHFSAGADIENLYANSGKKGKFKYKLKKGHKILAFIENLNIPTISAISGACFGGGLEIALSTHIRVSSENALFSFPEIELGLIPGLNGSYRLSKLLKRSKVIELLLSGDIIDAEKAHSAGIVDYVVAKNEVLNFSLALLKKLTDNRPMEVINFIIKSLNNSRNFNLKKAMKKEMIFFCKLALKESKNLSEERIK
jgi:enoyl-CoA hydratase/carnithine racemase